jgi:long-chain acyl-CoA synthetase
VCSYDEVLEAGKANESWSVFDASPDDIYMFSYTSGTTGDPKGVKLSHKMVIQCAEATNVKMGKTKLTKADCYPSYLPAAHSFEQAL